MKDLLHEFAERDFSAEEMWDVFDWLRDIESDMRALRIHRKHGHIDFVLNDKIELHNDVRALQSALKELDLDYDAKDLLESETLKELEGEQ